MRRFRREGVHHYGGAGAQRIHARRRSSYYAMARHNAQDEDDNSGTSEGISTHSGGEVVREDREETEGQGD